MGHARSETSRRLARRAGRGGRREAPPRPALGAAAPSGEDHRDRFESRPSLVAASVGPPTDRSLPSSLTHRHYFPHFPRLCLVHRQACFFPLGEGPWQTPPDGDARIPVGRRRFSDQFTSVSRIPSTPSVTLAPWVVLSSSMTTPC